MTTTDYLTPTELDALLEAARAARSSNDIETIGALVALADPATIERLVLMVQELKQEPSTVKGHWADTSEDLASVLLKHDEIHDQLSEARRQRDSLAANFDKYSRDVVEHFRARAVRALRKELNKFQAQTATLDGLARAGCEGRDWSIARLVTLIQSLPLVETEEK